MGLAVTAWAARRFEALETPIHGGGVSGARRGAVGWTQLGTTRVVGPDRFPGRAVTAEALGQNPGADLQVRARLEQVGFANAVSAQDWQPARIDLHQADVDRSRACDVAAIDRLALRLDSCCAIA